MARISGIKIEKNYSKEDINNLLKDHLVPVFKLKDSDLK